jgi:hypothetical protein
MKGKYPGSETEDRTAEKAFFTKSIFSETPSTHTVYIAA